MGGIALADDVDNDQSETLIADGTDVVALNENGQEVWRYDTGSNVSSVSVIDGDIVATADHYIIHISDDGAEIDRESIGNLDAHIDIATVHNNDIGVAHVIDPSSSHGSGFMTYDADGVLEYHNQWDDDVDALVGTNAGESQNDIVVTTRSPYDNPWILTYADDGLRNGFQIDFDQDTGSIADEEIVEIYGAEWGGVVDDEYTDGNGIYEHGDDGLAQIRDHMTVSAEDYDAYPDGYISDDIMSDMTNINTNIYHGAWNTGDITHHIMYDTIPSGSIDIDTTTQSTPLNSITLIDGHDTSSTLIAADENANDVLLATANGSQIDINNDISYTSVSDVTVTPIDYDISDPCVFELSNIDCLGFLDSVVVIFSDMVFLAIIGIVLLSSAVRRISNSRYAGVSVLGLLTVLGFAGSIIDIYVTIIMLSSAVLLIINMSGSSEGASTAPPGSFGGGGDGEYTQFNR